MKKIIPLIALFLLLPLISPSQIIQSVPSPTAVNLGTYGEVPVSHYTGTPNISIPIYELKGKNITLPISLTYHPAGIRPEIHPSPTGLGWTLQAGGVITRTIIGNAPDESQSSVQARAVNGYLQYAGTWISEPSWKQYISNIVSEDCQACRTMVHYSSPFSDTEPDEFNFTLPGLSGKFWFDQTGNIQVQCDRPVKVVFENEFIQPWEVNLNYESSTLNTYFQRSFKSFVIIDEFGTRYYFGGSDAIEFSDPIFYGYANNREVPAMGYLLHANSWFLNKIESADSSDVIHFEYERGPFVCQLFKASNSFSYNTANSNGFTISLLVKSGTITSPVYLKKISRSNGETIDFILNSSTELSYSQNDYTSVFQSQSNDDYLLLNMTLSIPRLNENYYSNKFDRIQWLKLDTINVKNSESSRIKAITFCYNNNPEERLFLESLRFKGGELPGSQPEPEIRYDFSYNNKNKLGGYLSSITDHWGYNNGKGFPTNGIITKLRNPNPDFMDAGVLSEIHYPTGGYTKFFFEPHDYSKVVNTKNRGVINSHTGIGGGLRVRRIISGDSTGIIQRRDFFYRVTPDSSGVSSSTGVLNIQPTYIKNISGYDCDAQPFMVSSMKSYPVIPLSTENDGLNIGYTTICELYDEGSDGYAKYEYTNHDNGHSDTLLTNDLWNRDIFPQDPHCSRYFERGRLKKEMLYGHMGNLTYSRQINWSRYGSQGEDNPRAFYFGGLKLTGGYDYCSSVPYLHYTYKFLRNEQREYNYYTNGQNPVYTVNKYLYTAPPYNPVGLLSRETIINSDSDSLSVNYRYAGDVLGASAPTPFLNNISKGVTKMLQRNMRGVILEKTNIRNNLVTGSVVKYYVESNGQLQPSEELHLQSNTPVDNYTRFIINPATRMPVFDSRLNSELRYDLYDNIGNLLQATGRDGVPTSYVWGYKQQYVVAVVRGAAYPEVKSALGHASDGNDLTYLQKYGWSRD